jgi:hypothetical protein
MQVFRFLWREQNRQKVAVGQVLVKNAQRVDTRSPRRIRSLRAKACKLPSPASGRWHGDYESKGLAGAGCEIMNPMVTEAIEAS